MTCHNCSSGEVATPWVALLFFPFSGYLPRFFRPYLSKWFHILSLYVFWKDCLDGNRNLIEHQTNLKPPTARIARSSNTQVCINRTTGISPMAFGDPHNQHASCIVTIGRSSACARCNKFGNVCVFSHDRFSQVATSGAFSTLVAAPASFASLGALVSAAFPRLAVIRASISVADPKT